MAPVPIAEGLFTGPPDDLRLIASACEACGLVVFPAQRSCPACRGTDLTERLLGPRGSLYTWTTQSFPPVAPPYLGDTDRDTFEPYGIGWVQVADDLMIESRLTESDPDRLDFGLPVELVVIPVAVDEAGDDVVTFAFRPVHGPSEERA